MSSEIEVLLDLLVRLGEIQTNYTSFIKKFPVIAEKRDTGHYIHGDIKLCGTISGRPSGGGDINLLALPSTGSKLAKPVKQIMTAPKGRLVVTADYNAQEDVAASIVTKDPNMLMGKILGRDGHSSRALAYFPELLSKHTKLIRETENASESVTFWIDDSKSGIDKFIIKEK